MQALGKPGSSGRATVSRLCTHHLMPLRTTSDYCLLCLISMHVCSLATAMCRSRWTTLCHFLSATVFEGTCQVTLRAQACWCLSFQRPFDLSVDPWDCRFMLSLSFGFLLVARVLEPSSSPQEESLYSLVFGCLWQSSVLLTSSELSQLLFCWP